MLLLHCRKTNIQSLVGAPPPLSSLISVSVLVVFVFCLFTPFLSVLFAFHRKNLALLHLMNRYATSKRVIFIKRRHCGKLMLDISELFSVIQIAAVGTWHVVVVYIYMGVSVYWSLCVLGIFVCMCAWSNQTTIKKRNYVSDLSKLDDLLHKTASSFWY